MTAADMLKAASGLFSVFDRNKAGEEVRRLEDDIKDAGEVQAKLLRAEHKAALAREKAEKAHRLTATAPRYTEMLGPQLNPHRSQPYSSLRLKNVLELTS